MFEVPGGAYINRSGLSGGSLGSNAASIRKGIPDILSNLLVYYKLEEASGTRVDSSGNGIDLSSVLNAPGNATGKIGSGLQIVRASNQHCDSVSTVAIDYTTPFTVVMWVKAASASMGLSRGLVGFQTNTPMNIFFSAGNHAQFSQNANTITITHSATLVADTWYFFCIRVTPGSPGLQEISVNAGTMESQAGSSLSTTTKGVVRIGTIAAQNNFFDGVIDEVAIYGRKLTDAQITYIYNGGSGRSIK